MVVGGLTSTNVLNLSGKSEMFFLTQVKREKKVTCREPMAVGITAHLRK